MFFWGDRHAVARLQREESRLKQALICAKLKIEQQHVCSLSIYLTIWLADFERLLQSQLASHKASRVLRAQVLVPSDASLA